MNPKKANPWIARCNGWSARWITAGIEPDFEEVAYFIAALAY